MLSTTIVEGGTSLQLVLRRPDYPAFEVVLGDQPLALGTGADVDIMLTGVGIEAVHARVSVREIEAIADLDVGNIPLRAGSRRTSVPSMLQIGSVTLSIEMEAQAHSSVATRELALRSLEAPALLWPSVVVVEGPARGRTLILRDDGTRRVGRDPQGDLVIDDAKMSRAHFEIMVADGAVFVRDCGSTGGVWLGASRLDRGRKAKWRSHRMLLAGQSVFALMVPEAFSKRTPAAPPSAEAIEAASTTRVVPPLPAADEKPDTETRPGPHSVRPGVSSPIALVAEHEAPSAASAHHDHRLRAVVLVFAATCVLVLAGLGYLLIF